jgi:hypothetical protein
MALQPFFGSHLMALMAIKGLGPALGAIYIHSSFRGVRYNILTL